MRAFGAEHLQYGDPRGSRELRAAIADHLLSARGLRCDPDQIMLTSGTQHSLRIVLSAILAAFLTVLPPSTASAAASKYSAIVIDAVSGKTLYAQSADAQRHPASLTKMMTLYILFEELDAGRMKLTTPLDVSAAAAGQAPSKLGLRAGSTIKVEDAILGIVTKSANDAAWVVGENIGGSVPAFAQRMNKTARALGMMRSGVVRVSVE